MQFSEKDIQFITNYGLSTEEVNRQTAILQNGLPATTVLSAARPKDGIQVLSTEQETQMLAVFEDEKSSFSMQKFVPASGAATRMFKDWVFFHNNYKIGRHFYERFVKQNNLAAFPEELDDFLDSLPGFAFYQDLMDVIKQSDTSVFQMEENEQAWYFIHYILSDDGLAYARQPKAFLKFHRYGKKSITALEEHLKEAEVYAQGKNEIPEVHFTISPQHLQAFSALTNQLQEKYQVNITYSFQKPETDTVMIYKDNDEIVRDNQNQIVFRPGGHGALIDNIQDLDADIIFVKNIDNLQKGEKQADTLKFKKILAGYLMQIMQENKAHLEKLRDEKPIHDELKAIEDFARNKMNINFIEGYDSLNNSGKRQYLAYKLNRPIRIAGMVKNTGEPGGGPFWAADKNGLKSLQIVEKAQIDLSDAQQKQILEQATHFNPVDLVLSIKDFEGKKFDLKEFINEQAAFLSEKSYQGKAVKVYERPGLWNGAMDNWNTIFVEVPISTFSPVKTVVDLLKPEHN
jgi:hypothetical protein